MTNLKVSFLCLLIFISIRSSAQVDFFDISNQQDVQNSAQIPQYDSLYNFEISSDDYSIISEGYGGNKKDNFWNEKDSVERYLAERTFQFIGQTVFVCPTTTQKQKYNESHGLNTPKEFKELQGNYYVIDSIIPNTLYDTYHYPHRYKINSVKMVMHRLGDSSNTSNAYNIATVQLLVPSFLCMGYYEKLKMMYENKVFVTQYLIYLMDFVGNEISFPEGTEFRCFKVAIAEDKNYYYPHLFLEDTTGKQYKIPIGNSIWKLRKRSPFIEKQLYIEKLEQEKLAEKQAQEKKKLDAAAIQKQQIEKKNALIEKYGQYYGDLIFRHKVVIGMTKEMCTAALGKPDKVNRSVGSWGVNEQWVYKNLYLYFDGDKLTSFQD